MRHLTSIDNLTLEEVVQVFDKADYYLDKNSNCLSEKLVANVFFENSTRTLFSFEVAAKKLGANVVNIATKQSSINKGETIEDTFATLHKMSPDFMVVRAGNSGIPFKAALQNNAITINAGDGCNEHPTQALIDSFTIKKIKGKIAGLKVAICGDVLHSRVAHSNIKLLSTLGAEVRIISPPNLSLNNLPLGVTSYYDVQGLIDVDVIMILRLQYERMHGTYVSSKFEYFKTYGIDEAKLSYAKPNVIVMHPGPVNRGIEISSGVADNNHSVILDQVKFSIPVRQSVFDFLGSTQ